MAAKGVETLGLGAFPCKSGLALILLLALVGPKANLAKVELGVMATVKQERERGQTHLRLVTASSDRSALNRPAMGSAEWWKVSMHCKFHS